MAKRDEREKEEEILKERRLLKERQKEDHLYGDKEKFVTAAYKEKLAKDAVWQKIEAKKGRGGDRGSRRRFEKTSPAFTRI